VGEQLVRAGGSVGVLGEAQDLKGPPSVAGCGFRLAPLGVQAGLRPAEMGQHARVAGVLAEGECASEQLFCAPEVPAVDQRVSEEHGKLDGEEQVVAPLGLAQAALEDPDRGFELSDHRVRAP
jgi:hypothetical protein